MTLGSTWNPIGNPADGLGSTDWETLAAAQKDNNLSRRQIALTSIAERYWKPIYLYLRRKGQNHNTAKDNTQAFFCDVIIDGSLLHQAKESRGKFRNLLFTSLDHFIISLHRKQTAQKRSPSNPIVSLDNASVPIDQAPIDRFKTPADIYNYAWAADILDRAINQTKSLCIENNEHNRWDLFEKRLLNPTLMEHPPPSMKKIYADLGFDSPKQASNALTTIKRRFIASLRQEIRNTVQSDKDVDEELIELVKILSRPNAS